MRALTQLFRLIHINFVLAKHGLDEIVFATGWLSPMRFLMYLNPWFWLRDKSKTKAQRLRLTLQELGPIFVKFGQMLSTRADLLPVEYITELSKLQDKVLPFSQAKTYAEKIYGCELSEYFISFDAEPLASASIAQVHSATLLDGRNVVVKILRPNIEKTIRRDIGLLYRFAKLVEKYWKPGKRLHPVAVIREFENTLLHELDLLREAANASQLRRNFENSDLLYIPEIYWPLTRHRIMVMERIEGLPISHIDELRANNIDLKVLAERGVEIFFTQVFRDCFFHADMHPGNIFVSVKNPKKPQYLAVDFGIMGNLSPRDQRYLAENMLAFFKRDYQRVAVLHIESGWVAKDTRVDEFAAAIRTVCEPIFERPLKDISCGQLLMRLLQVGKEFHMEIQPQLLLLQKTLIHIEGLGRQLYPDLDLWSTAQPFLEKWVRKQVGVKSLFRKMKEQSPFMLEKLPELPMLIYQQLQQQAEPAQQNETEITEHKNLQISKRGFLKGLGFSFVLFAIFLSPLVQKPLYFLQMDNLLSWVFAAAGLLFFFTAMLDS